MKATRDARWNNTNVRTCAQVRLSFVRKNFETVCHSFSRLDGCHAAHADGDADHGLLLPYSIYDDRSVSLK